VATSKGRISAISVSERRGTPKSNVSQVSVKEDFGIVGDAHAGPGDRQISLLTAESIDRLRESGAEIAPGDFAENLTVEGIEPSAFVEGCKLKIGGSVELQVTQLGKQCHDRCEVFKRIGTCIMPKEGVFARVLKSGQIKVGDILEVVDG